MTNLKYLLIGIIIVPLVIFLAIFFTSDSALQSTVKVEFLKILLQLLLLSAMGTIVKLILENYNDSKKKAELEIEKNRNLVRERNQHFTGLKKSLINSLQNVRRSRSIIIANKSAKTYGIQMQEIMNSKFEIGDLKEEIINSEYPISNTLKLESKKALNGIEKYISDLVEEYRVNYKELSETQNNTPKEVWPKLSALHHLKGFLQPTNDGTYQQKLLADYFTAKRSIGKIGKENQIHIQN